MIETDEIRCKVAGQYNDHYWLELLDQPEQGMRVSVPIHYEGYAPELEREIEDWEIGDILTVVLFSKTESPSRWRVRRIVEGDGSSQTDERGETNGTVPPRA